MTLSENARTYVRLRTAGRTTTKHNASRPIYWKGRHITIRERFHNMGAVFVKGRSQTVKSGARNPRLFLCDNLQRVRENRRCEIGLSSWAGCRGVDPGMQQQRAGAPPHHASVPGGRRQRHVVTPLSRSVAGNAAFSWRVTVRASSWTLGLCCVSTDTTLRMFTSREHS